MAQKPAVKLAVFGKPVKHSLSPRIHGLFAEQFGLPIDYKAIEATAASLPELVTSLADRGGVGCNITVPLKHEAWKLGTRSSENANRARAANTLVLGRGHDWFADSTDGPGLVADLQSLPGCKLEGARICLLGAGGAASSVLGSLLKAGPGLVQIANRTRERAMELARSHADLGPVDYGTPAELDSLAPFDLVINATSLGHEGCATRLSPDWLTGRGYCYDMNYAAAARPLRVLCAQKKISYSDGLGMLVGQAALSFRLWTGHAPDTSAVLQILRG